MKQMEQAIHEIKDENEKPSYESPLPKDETFDVMFSVEIDK